MVYSWSFDLNWKQCKTTSITGGYKKGLRSKQLCYALIAMWCCSGHILQPCSGNHKKKFPIVDEMDMQYTQNTCLDPFMHSTAEQLQRIKGNWIDKGRGQQCVLLQKSLHKRVFSLGGEMVVWWKNTWLGWCLNLLHPIYFEFAYKHQARSTLRSALLEYNVPISNSKVNAEWLVYTVNVNVCETK